MIRALPLTDAQKAMHEFNGVPFEHRPLSLVPWSHAVRAGVDVEPGELVEKYERSQWRWALVWNDAIGEGESS